VEDIITDDDERLEDDAMNILRTVLPKVEVEERRITAQGDYFEGDNIQ
jgi:hypothetical protein